jgi:Polysaccharide lyase
LHLKLREEIEAMSSRNWRLRRLLLIPVLIIGAVGAPSADAQQALLYDSNFEGSLGDGWKASGNTPIVQNQISRVGTHAMKSELNRLESETSYRTEVRLLKPLNAKWFEDTWYGFSIYLPGPYPDDDKHDILAQWHGAYDTDLGEKIHYGPALSLVTKSGEWKINASSTPEPVTTKENKVGYTTYAGPIEVNKWTDWVFRVRWDYRTAGSGRLTVWKNGKQILDRAHPIGYNDHVGPYFKMGIYKPNWQTESSPFGNVRIVYHDAFRIAAGPSATYADVAPGPVRSPPVPPVLSIAR